MEKNEKEFRKMDWHLFWTAGGVILVLGAMVLGSYLGLSNNISEVRNEIVKIQTVLIIKGIAPSDLFSSEKK